MTSVSAPVRASRAGRDLPAAIAVGAALGALIIVTLFTYRPAFAGVVALAAAYGSWELVTALRAADHHPPAVPLVVGAAATVLAAYLGGAAGSLAGLTATCAAVAVWAWRGRSLRVWMDDVAAGVLTAAYVAFLASFAALLAEPHDGARRTVTFIATVVASDIGGYAVGVLSGGRHKLAPQISPGKSWEGLAGSVAVCVASGVLWLSVYFDRPAWQGAVFGAAMAAAAVLGDLAESAIKRDIGVKDMGRLLPGHGGLLDRLDSLLVAAPLAWLLISAFAPVR
jgi:phosphatidate cytidylyltransferase